LDKAPKVVRDAVKAKYPKAQIVAAEKGDQDGKAVYEFDLKDGEKKWEVSFTPKALHDQPRRRSGSGRCSQRSRLLKSCSKFQDCSPTETVRRLSGLGTAGIVPQRNTISLSGRRGSAQNRPSGRSAAAERNPRRG